MRQHAEEVIDEQFLESLVDLFEFYDGRKPIIEKINADKVEEAIEFFLAIDSEVKTMISTSIGLANDEFACSLCLTTHMETIHTLYRGNLDNPIDWMGELSNQAAGRMKNYLAEYEVSSVLATPVTISGEGLSFPVQTANTTVCQLETSAGIMVALLNKQTHEELYWEYSEVAECAQEGSLTLF